MEIARFFAELQGNIAAERRELHGLVDRLQIAESRPRKVSAWLTEKFTELKLRLDDSARGPLRLLESLEVLGLGIHGKLALWRALYAAADVSPELQSHLAYERMAQRAEEQRCVEVVRPEAAKAAFAAAREFS